MKKTVLAKAKAAALASLAAVVLLAALAACVTGSSKNPEAAGYRSWEGQYYEHRFEQYWSEKSMEDRNIPRRQTQSVLKGFDRLPKPDSIMDEQPSEQDIDRAIAAYEKSLELEPSGTWSFSGGLVYLEPPEGGVKAALARAQEKKQEWLTKGKPVLEAALATKQQAQQAELARQQQAQQAQQAEIARQQAENASTNPNSPNDFDIMQNKDGGITITKYKGSRTNVIIPSTISGLRVTEIGELSFGINVVASIRYNNSLQSVVIPNTVTSIGRYAFGGCEKLSSVTLSSSLITIESYAFRSCSSLTSIAFPNSLTTIGNYAFAGCSLTSVTLPNRLTDIREYAFRKNYLTTLQLPASLKSVDRGAFDNNPLTSVVIPASLATVNGFRYAFRSYDKDPLIDFTRITMPANVDDSNLPQNFEDSFVNYYKLQGKKAGTYVKENRIWKLQ